MATALEQQYRADILRQRMRERVLQQAEEENNARAEGVHSSISSKKKQFSISTLEAGLWMIPAIIIDSLEALGALMAAIPFIGLAIAGASAVVAAVGSGILFLVVTIWLLLKGVSPFTKRGIRIYLILGATAFGNAVISWFPAWSGFFFALFMISYKRNLMPHVANNK